MDLNSLVADMKAYLTHTGRELEFDRKDAQITFKIKNGSASATCSFSIYKASGNCGLTYIHGMNYFFSFVSVKAVFDETSDDWQIIFDYIMSILEQHAWERYTTNIISYSVAFGSEQDMTKMDELLKRRQKLGVTMQWHRTNFSNSNSKNHQYLISTYIGDNRIPVPMDSMTDITVDAKSLRPINLKNYKKFRAYWESWEAGTTFLLNNKLLEFEAIMKDGVTATFITIESNNENNIGKELKKKMSLTEAPMKPANAIEIKKYMAGIQAEKDRMREVFKRDALYKAISEAKGKTFTIVPRALLNKETIYVFVRQDGSIHLQPLVLADNDCLRVYGEITLYKDPALLDGLAEFQKI